MVLWHLLAEACLRRVIHLSVDAPFGGMLTSDSFAAHGYIRCHLFLQGMLDTVILEFRDMVFFEVAAKA